MGLQTPEPPWDESKQVPDEEIDFSDIPEIESWEWKYARRMSHPEAFSKELSDAYDAEWRERNRQKLAREGSPTSRDASAAANPRLTELVISVIEAGLGP